MTLFRRIVLFLGLGALCVACDQWTKAWAIANWEHQPTKIYFGDIFRFTFARNEGAFLSLGSTLSESARYWILTVAVGLLLLSIVVFALWNKTLRPSHVAGYALIAGGGFSNWIDRALHSGSVVDFMNMGIKSLRTGIFNVADVAILIGIGFILVFGNPNKKPLPVSSLG